MSRITTPFGFLSTASDVLRGVDLTGQRAIVTGGASGIGLETARALVTAGAEVTLAVRRPEAAQEAARELRAAKRGEVRVEALDLADLPSVRRFTAHWRGQLHILVNNAGVMAVPELQTTPQGWELQFATNFLGHFALVNHLHGALAAANGARIVSLSSSAHLLGPVVFDDLHFRFRSYEPFAAYAQAKTACVLLAVEANRRWNHEGIFANAVHPGAIATTLQSTPAGSRRLSSGARPPRKGQRRRCCWRPHPCSRAWVGATSRIALNRSWLKGARLTSPVSHPTPSTRQTLAVCGRRQPSSSAPTGSADR